jgi:predicted site-specific integrase-resolvase
VLSFKEDIKSMKRVAIYARVSTEKQEKTIDSQIGELRKFCEKNNFLIVKEYVDDGWILVCAKMLLTLLKLLEL